ITEQVAAVEIPDVSPHPTEDHSADDDDSHDSEIIPEGERNTALTCYAGAFRAQGQTFQEIREQLLIINAKNCKPPLPEQEVEGIARSVARYKPNGKRQRIRPDENKLFWVKLEVNKILGDPDIRLMKEEQRGWFMFLLLEAWKAGGTLPADDRSLYVLLGCSSKQRWKRMKDEVLKKFRREIDSEGNPILVLDWMAETYAEQLNALNQRISAGKKSGEARAQKAAASKKGAQAASGAQMEAASLTA
ncbi:MAG TPA: primase C-terminal domain-containing protein, partial [Terriglobales bacterium]|nr:primase C-terminal domain-containing protein [Terriglobales bacterium]